MLAVFAVFTLMFLWPHDWAGAQTIGRTIGPSGGFGAGLGGPLGGIGGTQPPLHLSNDLIAPDLRGTLPDIQTPELELPPNFEPAITGNGGTVGNREETTAIPIGTATNSDDDVQQQRAEASVNDEVSRHLVAASGGAPDDEDEDDDDDEDGNMPWWLWLLLVLGVAVVGNWLRR